MKWSVLAWFRTFSCSLLREGAKSMGYPGWVWGFLMGKETLCPLFVFDSQKSPSPLFASKNSFAPLSFLQKKLPTPFSATLSSWFLPKTTFFYLSSPLFSFKKCFVPLFSPKEKTSPLFYSPKKSLPSFHQTRPGFPMIFVPSLNPLQEQHFSSRRSARFLLKCSPACASSGNQGGL